MNTTRGGLYWPHRANIRYGGRRLPYFIVQEGGSRMNDISVFCHEFGHMLGLPDLYARPEQPGSEGVWQWCAMSNQIGNGRPQHFCAWSKEQLGWIKPTVIDPRVKQKLVLSPDRGRSDAVLQGDGAGRRQRVLPAGEPQEDGVGFAAARRGAARLAGGEQQADPGGVARHRGRTRTELVPFVGALPEQREQQLHARTRSPSSKSQLGGGLPVWITNIRKLPDGRITFHVGYEFQ